MTETPEQVAERPCVHNEDVCLGGLYLGGWMEQARRLREERDSYKEVLRHIAVGDGLTVVPHIEIIPMWQRWAWEQLRVWDPKTRNVDQATEENR